LSLDHVVREPAAEPQGALILNHGRGADEHDLYRLLDVFDPDARLLGVTPGAPLSAAEVAARSALPVGPRGRHWYAVKAVGYPEPETFGSAYSALGGFLDDLLAERGIEWSRTVIGGFSMGAVMSYAVGLGPDRPKPAAILALSGFVPMVAGWEPDLESRGDLPVLIHHGSNDPVIPVDFGRRAAELLADGGLDVDYRETPAGHFVPPEVIVPAKELIAGVTAG
jgi:phospholipase/carboxylesterase